MSTASAGATPVDLDNCDREPIHIPGSIQPHGLLLAFDEADLRIVSASASAAAHLGTTVDALLGSRLSALLDATALERVRTPPSGVTPSGLDAFPLRAGGTPWTALVHRHDGLAILELEPVNAPREEASALMMVSAAARNLQGTSDPVAACAIVTAEVRRITGFDRVKLYRFAADWSGEVLAESRDAAMPSYLGLHFPATDIPVQARALYVANPVRLIADAHYVPSPLVPDRNPGTGGPIDLRYAALRSVSPIHLEYLRNMGVGASMSASVVRQGTLWGLIACHHRTALLVDFERRQACALLAQLLAAHLDALDRIERARRIGRVEALRVNLLQAMADGLSVAEALARNGNEVLKPAGATGFAMIRPDEITVGGTVPDADFLRGLATWLTTSPHALAANIDRLGALYPEALVESRIASGLLGVPLARTEGSWLLWFRPEQLQSVHWAGEPAKAVERVGDEQRLHPRKSFATWTERVHGRSQPWTSQDVAAAAQLREVVLDLFVREKDELERRNLRLSMSARELETFIYVASHDIKEPLRQMEMLTSLLRGHLRDENEPEAAGYLSEFKVVANRLRDLTDGLADYAKLGRTALAFVPVRLDEVVEEVLVQFRTVIADTGARVHAGPLPVIAGDRTQLYQVFVNLVGNALKYRALDREPEVTITAEPITDDDAMTAARPMSRIVVRDNGIGFDPRYEERVFEAFWRLHPRDRYEGSGIGLAICRRIVERHGGRVEAQGRPGAGASFALLLPTTLPPSTALPGDIA